MPEEFSPSRGNVLDTISMSKEYKITFSLKANSFPPHNTYHSVFHFTPETVEVESNPIVAGCRNPSLWILGEGKPHVTFYNTRSPNHNDVANLDPIRLGGWTKFEISSTFAEDRDIHVFRVKINGQQVLEKDNPDAGDYSEIHVQSGNHQQAPLDGVIKDFFVSA